MLMQVVEIPYDMTPGGKGPLLAANNIDLQILWHRLKQMHEIGQKLKETFRAEAYGVTSSCGLLVMLGGIRGFVPWSHIPKGKKDILDEKDLEVCGRPL
jgi:ribosomal protein S1